MGTLEISKKTSKVNQIMTSNHILQSQMERMREESEEERLAVSREISHLNAIISEKNSIIERLKAEGNHEMDKQVFEVGLTLHSTELSESTFDGLFDASFDPNAILFDSSMKGTSQRVSPRGEKISELENGLFQAKTLGFTKKGSNPVDITDIGDSHSVSKPPPRKSTQDVSLQTEISGIETQLSKSTPAETQALPLSNKAMAISKADAEHIAALDVQMKETTRSLDYYKQQSADKDKKIECLYASMKQLADDNSRIVNDLSLELDRVSGLLRRQRLK